VKPTPGFITWQPVLTDHQAYTYLALQERSGQRVLSFVTAKEDEVRRAQGWKEAQVDMLTRVLLPKRGMWSFCWAQLREYRHSVHVFASPFQQPRLILVLLLAAYMGLTVYLISEPFSPIGDGYYADHQRWRAYLKSKLRPMLYRLYALLLRRRIRGVFTISKLAERQYQKAGISVEKLMPFGYFVPKTKVPAVSEHRPMTPSRVRCVFVGSLIRRKGLDLLMEAMVDLSRRGVPCDMDVYGPGNASLLKGCVGMRYCGTIPFGSAQAVIAQYDLLVLPSRHDGWGVVVNEAICAGVPVLCSDRTGAGDMAVALGAARFFASDDPGSLVREIEALTVRPEALAALKRATASAADHMQPAVAADYLLACVRASGHAKQRFSSPWYRESS
jgi:glycosyltransferase involved in cell wall biosynthesis